MTETITIRLRRPKSELLKKSGGNLNRWVNALIEQALDQPAPDWDAHFRRPRRKFLYRSDEIRRQGDELSDSNSLEARYFESPGRS